MIQLLPQVWKSWREKSTEGLSPYLGLTCITFTIFIDTHNILRFLWGVSGAFFGVYAIVQDLNVPLIIQPQVLSFLSLVSWIQVSSYS